MAQQASNPDIIELDDPPPRGYRVMLACALLIALMLVVTPFLMGTGSGSLSSHDMQQQQQIRPVNPDCRPMINVPRFLQPLSDVALPSFARVCDWFSEPGT